MHQIITCENCGVILAAGKDTGGAPTNISVICVCGNKNNVTFLGYPNLFGTENYYFDFTDEFEITCHKR